MSSGTRAALVLGRYRIVRQLGQGGMGVVYLGRVEGGAGFSKPVVIKRIRSEISGRQDNTARFIREARILSQLQHPNIVSVLDFGEEGDGYAMVLEYMHGYDLACWMRYLKVESRPLHWEEALLILLRALDGLHYAHTFRFSDGSQRGVLHRDISPGNILLDIDGQVRLLDFGIARPLEADASQFQTTDGVLSGKTGYLAPELFSNAPSSVASDVYACAVVAYYLLTGVHPFLSQSECHTMWRVLQEPAKPLTALRGDLPAALDPVVLRALAKEPGERHASARELATDLRKLLTRSEADLQRALAEHVRRDFTGDLPEVLKIEPLAQREQAWSAEQGLEVSGSALLRSSRLPPAPAPPGEALTFVASPAARANRGAQGAGAPPAVPPLAPLHLTVSPLPAPPFAAPRLAAPPLASLLSPQPEERPRRRWHWSWALGGGVLLLAGGLIVQQSTEPTPTAGQFIVVQSPASGASNTAAASKPFAGHAEAAGAAGAPATPVAISRQLARRQSALQSCFQESAGAAGVVEATLHVQLAAAGTVLRASLEPAALEATPMGQCLLRVARETSFEPLPEPLKFSVPLRARVVAR